jgi:AcrR family transcriptional regulator
MTPDTARRVRARRGDGELLRAEILAAARDLLAETGSEAAVSIRGVADRVGVTPPSIYLHFPDKEALLEAVCAEVFTALDEAMEEAAAATPDPFEALRERGLAYVRFALANPEHYRIVLMRRRELDIGPHNIDELAEDGAFGHLLDSVRSCQASGVFDSDDDAAQLALALWAAAHGVAALMISHPWLGEDPEPLMTRVIDAIGIGLATAREN